MSLASSKRAVPLKPGLFQLRESGEIAHLIGSHCKTCGECFYPKRCVCLNCGRRELEEVALSTTGKIWSYTIARQKPPFSLVEVPYVIAVVELAEKVTVLTIVENCDLNSVEIGMEVKLMTKKVKQDEAGNDVVAFAFEPVKQQL